MFRFRVKRNTQKTTDLIPTQFKQYVVKKKRSLNELLPENKLIAALNLALSIQGEEDNTRYYVAGDNVKCSEMNVSEGKYDKLTKRRYNSYYGKGVFKMGSLPAGGGLTFAGMKFTIKFRDADDEMGLPTLIIEDAPMMEIPKSDLPDGVR